MRARTALRLLWKLTILGALVASQGCFIFDGDGDGDPAGGDMLTPEVPLPVGLQRSFTIEATYGDRPTEERLVYPVPIVGLDDPSFPDADPPFDPDWTALLSLVAEHCSRTFLARFDAVGSADANCQFKVGLQQTWLCTGHLLLAMADSPLAWSIETSVPFSPGDGVSSITDITVRQMTPAELEAATAPPTILVPPQSSSGAATLALQASEHFRQALLFSGDALNSCQDGTLTIEIPTSRTDGEDGLSPTDTVPLAVALVTGAEDALESMREAVAVGRSRILATSLERRTSERDSERGAILSWRAIFDSRLEIANRLVGVSPRMFEGDSELEVYFFPFDGRSGPLPAFGDYPVVTSVSRDAADVRGEALIRSVAIDPAASDLPFELHSAMFEDHPDVFPSPMVVSSDEFVRTLGTDSAALVRAARRIVQQAAVSGRPIVAEADVLGPSAPPRTVPRVTGTRRVVTEPAPAYLYALTAGGVRIDQSEFIPGPSPLGGPASPHSEYAMRSLYGSVDFVAAALTLGMERPDIRSLPAEHLDSLERTVMTLVADAHNDVPIRGDLRVGGMLGLEFHEVDELRLNLYGVDDTWSTGDPDPFELWWGEEGLECATTGYVGHLECDDALYRFTGVVLTSHLDGGESGHGDYYVSVQWNGPPPPVVARDGHPGDNLPAAGRVYLIHRERTGEREAWAGFDLRPAFIEPPMELGRWERETQYAIGPRILADLADALSTAPTNPSRPAVVCEGIRSDTELPLEDELTEAATGRDDIESSFVAYLAAASRAAAHADSLAEDLLATGLQMDLRGEAARDDLENVCGGTFNVPPLSAVGPSCAMGEACSPGTACLLGTCIGAGIENLLPEGDAGLEPLERCLGDDGGELVAVTLGREPVCMFRYGAGGLCACREGDVCPPCPQVVGSACGTSEGPFAGLGVGYTIVESVTLELTDEPTLPTGGQPPDCYALARLRTRVWDDGTVREAASGEDTLAQVLGQPWLRFSVANSLIESLSYRMEPYAFRTVLRGGRTWLSEGSVRRGPNNEFPCAPLLDPSTDEAFAPVFADLGCSRPGAPLAGDSILCGMDCGLPVDTYNLPPQELEFYTYADPLRSQWGRLRTSGERIDAAVRALQHPDPFFVPVPRLTMAPWCPVLPQDTPGAFVPVDAVPIPSMGSHGDAEDVYALYRLAGEEYGPEHIGDRFACVATNDTPLSTPNGVGVCPSTIAEDCQLPDRWNYLYRSAESSSEVQELWRPGPAEDDRGRSVGAQLARVYSGAADPFGAEPGYYASLMDGLELLCLSAQQGGSPGGCPDLSDGLPEIETADDFVRFELALDCLARQVNQSAASLVFPDVPASIAQDVRRGAASSTAGEYRGTYGQGVAQLRARFEQVNRALAQAATAISNFSAALRRARSGLAVEDLQSTIESVGLASTMESLILQCAAAMSPTVGYSGGFAPSVSVNTGSIFTCLDNLRRILAERRLSDLRERQGDERRRQFFDDIAVAYRQTADALAEAGRMMIEANADITTNLVDLQNQRRSARRSLSQALFLEEDAVGREYAVNRVYRTRYDSLRVRYERARQDAIRLAWLARLAIEQRLGVRMDEMSRDMTLVSAPSTWADSVCAVTGVDYEGVRTGASRNYADQYIGDYVRRLESFVESYRIDYPFQDGDDVAVLSLKTDLLNVREQCDVEGYNLLYWSTDLSRDAAEGGWMPTCSDVTGYCATSNSVVESPFWLSSTLEGILMTGEGPARPLGEVQGAALQVGCPPEDIPTGGTCPTADNDGTGIAQAVAALPPGTYVLSWYEELEEALPASLTCGDVVVDQSPRMLVEASAGAPLTIQTMADLGYPSGFMAGGDERELDACRWRRTFVQIENPVEQDLELRLVFADPVAATAGPVTIAAPQLEESFAVIRPGERVRPRAFFGTDADLSGPLDRCEDQDGSEFRSGRYWAYNCEYLCPDGASDDCEGREDEALRRCFWEARFALDLPSIERGELVSSDSFAVGNFNYRMGRLALNVVGTGVRDCSAVGDTSACFASGFVPYSLVHEGPYRVRNHEGDTVRSRLFTGRVQYAKSLLAERYLTNPVSSADRALLEDYWREEFRGRPLDGNYRLRIYDVPGIQWQQVEDVQLIVDYRYWTRQE